MQSQMLIALCCSSAQENEGKALEIIFYEQSVSHKKKRGGGERKKAGTPEAHCKDIQLYVVSSTFQNDHENSVGC